MNILFVCTGNTCRSVMAEYLMKTKAAQAGRTDLRIASAGTHAATGGYAMAEAVAVLAERGIKAEGHRTRPVDPREAREADRIVVMTEAHRRFLMQTFGLPAEQMTLLVPDGVPDPVGDQVDGYRRSLGLIERGVDRLLEEVPRGSRSPR